MASIKGGLVVALLAAGGSTRFGTQDKLAAMLGDRLLIGWASEAAQSVPAMRHVAVIRPDVPAASLPDRFALLPNTQAETGLSSSLRIAAQDALDAGADALMILLADMPFVGAAHLAAMLGRFGDRPLFSRMPGGQPQPPALFPDRLFPALATLTGDEGARRFAQEADFIEAAPDMLLDIDTPADLERARAMVSG